MRTLGEKGLIGKETSGDGVVYSVVKRFEGSRARYVELKIEEKDN